MFSLTDEQKAIIEHDGDARVVAVAGSGKTATLVEYAKAHPTKRILYVAYNRSVKLESQRKFAAAGCRNVTVETAHALAYRGMDVRNRFKLADGGLRVNDIAQLCGLKPDPKRPREHLVLARHVQQAMNLFCNSDARSFADIDYLSTVSDISAQKFVQDSLDQIITNARWIMAEMYRGNIPVLHDAYLKFYQLSSPSLSRYDTFLIDEAQDISPVMLDIFYRQAGSRIMVGDPHQSIYGFRHAINSLGLVSFPSFPLSRSFRFRQEVADLAMSALALKGRIGELPSMPHIIGAGESSEKKTSAILARSNVTLLREAINALLFQQKAKLCFEGGLETYTYMSEGASLFDVLYLRMGQREKIRSPFVRSFPGYTELKEYVEAAGDQEMRLVCEIVEEHSLLLFDVIRKLREVQVPREQADLILSTVHKAKGAEYDSVIIAEDFITGEKVDIAISRAVKEKRPLDSYALAEEINILYVALTRVKNALTLGFQINEHSPNEFLYDGTGKENQKTSKIMY